MKAMVLAAGLGTRLGGLTRETPKPMLDAGGRPIIDRILQHLSACGITEAVLNLHFRPEAIRDHVGDGSRYGLRVSYSHETALLGTAGALRKAAPLLGPGPFLVQYGDVVTDMDLRVLIRAHLEGGALATLVLHRRAGSNSAVRLEPDGRIAAFLERPGEEERQQVSDPWVNSGICACGPEILDRIPEGLADLPRDIFAPLAPLGLLRGIPLEGYRCAVDSPERLDELRAAIREGRCRISGTDPEIRFD
jgi:NDP-sugar pyrophosphorylase family protein